MNCPSCQQPMELIGNFWWHKNKIRKCPITSIVNSTLPQYQQGFKVEIPKRSPKVRKAVIKK